MRTHLVFIFAIVVFIAAAYANALKNDFVWDDEFLVRDNISIRSFSHAEDIFKSYLASSSGNRNNFYRPVQELSYMADYFLWGNDPMGFHLTNIILHTTCAILLYALMLRIFSGTAVAFVTALFFGVHPVNTEAVTYVAGRADPLYLLFFLLSIIFFLRSPHFLKNARSVKIPYYSASLLCFALAILSKEIAIVLPLFLWLHEACCSYDPDTARQVRRLYYPYLALCASYLLLRKTVLDFSGIAPSSLLGEFSLYERLLTMAKVVMTYAGILLFPAGLHMERVMPVSRSFFEPQTIVSVVALAFSVFGMVRAFGRNKRLFFASAWFFAGLLPVSNIVPINSFIAEHWLYLPAIGVFAILGIGIDKILAVARERIFFKTVVYLVVIAIGGMLAYLTAVRNRDWKDEAAFFKNTIAHSPNNARLHLNFGNTYYEQGKSREALEEYGAAAGIRPDYAEAWGNIGSIYIDRGEYDKAKPYLEKALAIKPDFPDALLNLGMIYGEEGDNDKALRHLELALKMRPDFVRCHMELASLYLKMDMVRDAVLHWKEALRINPGEKDAARLIRLYGR